MTREAELLGPAALLPAPLLLVGTDGSIVAANAAFRTYVGEHNVVGRPLGAFLATGEEALAEYLRVWARSGEWCPGGLTFKSADGRPLRTRAGGLRYVPPAGGDALVLLHLVPKSVSEEQFQRLNRHVADLTREITRRKRLEVERLQLLAHAKAAREQAELASRLKDEFLATLSHELRTPLNAVLGWARILRLQEKVSRTVDHGLSVIERNALLQAHLVDDLLDVSRSVTGRLRLDVAPVDLLAVARSAVETVRPAAANNSIRLDLAAPAEPLIVRGDASRLEQVVWNLLSNAVKFTPADGKVSVELRELDGHAELRVTDTGEGIAPAFLPHVFDRFRQADASPTRRRAGLGLGLALARALTEAHGGSVQAASEGPGRGATFTVRLPLDTAAAEAARLPAPPDAISLEGLRVLVVEDQLDARELLAILLTRAGAVPVAAASVADALRQFREQPPDLLLADIAMPGQDGLELIRTIRALPEEAGGAVPALAVTAYAASREREEALAAGYDNHVAKPYLPEQLLAGIADAIARQRAGRSGQSGQ